MRRARRRLGDLVGGRQRHRLPRPRLVSSGAVAVVEGEVVEERLVDRRVARADGAAIARGRRSASTRLTCTACATPPPRRAVSIHAYSPPLSRMGAYAVEPDGTLRRRSISYDEELGATRTAAA